MIHTPRQRVRLALLRVLARLTHPLAPQLPSRSLAEVRSTLGFRILVIRPDHMGDLLFVTPALRTLRQRYPDAHITALVGPWGVPVLSNNPHIDEIVSLPFPGFSRQPKPSFWQPYALLRCRARQMRGRFDLAFILRFDHWWGALLAYLAGVPQRVGYAVPEVTPFLSHAMPYTAGRHEVEQNLRLVNWDPLSERRPTHPHQQSLAVDYPLEFQVAEQTLAWGRDVLQNTRPIAIHPGAGAAVKLWQVERWATVADALANETDAQILLTGSAAEYSLCVEIAAHMETEARVMAGKTALDQLAAIQAECRLVLGLDSGPLHLAVAMGTPTVHLFGPVDRAAFGPWGPPARHAVLVSDWPCIPCNRLDFGPDELTYHPCVWEVDTNAVLTAARQVLAS